MKFKTTTKSMDIFGNFAVTLFAKFANFANNFRDICTRANKARPARPQWKGGLRPDRTSQHQRIEAPYYALLPNAIGKPLENLYSFRNGRHIRLQPLSDIVIQRELEVILPESKRFHLAQPLQQRLRFFDQKTIIRV